MQFIAPRVIVFNIKLSDLSLHLAVAALESKRKEILVFTSNNISCGLLHK